MDNKGNQARKISKNFLTHLNSCSFTSFSVQPLDPFDQAHALLCKGAGSITSNQLSESRLSISQNPESEMKDSPKVSYWRKQGSKSFTSTRMQFEVRVKRVQ